MKTMTRERRKGQITVELYRAWLQGKRLTSHEIADRVGLVPSQHLRGILYEMVTDGLINAFPVAHRPHIQKLVFTLNTHNLKKKKPWSWEYLETRFGAQMELPL